MPKPVQNLRIHIRKILEESYSISEERIDGTEDSDNEKVLDGVLFHDFGFYTLKEVNYQGNFDEIINRVKKRFVNMGWEFDEWDEGL